MWVTDIGLKFIAMQRWKPYYPGHRRCCTRSVHFAHRQPHRNSTHPCRVSCVFYPRVRQGGSLWM